MSIVKTLNEFILSPAVYAVLFICALVIFLRIRGSGLLSPVKIVKGIAESGGGIRSSFRALTVALAGTLGVGNIVGVATAIHMGGAGAVFWMLLSAFVAMIIKYAEIVLALKFRVKDVRGYHGGAAYYISMGLGKRGLALFFSLLCIIASFTLGNMIQVNAVSQAAESRIGIPPLVTGAVIALLSYTVIYKGIKGIADITMKLIPILSVSFVLLSLCVIIANVKVIPDIFSRIIEDAFKRDCAFGGIMGFLLMRSLRYGVVRGIGSNEAGCGTAPTAHATAESVTPEAQGYWGLIEVFVDTVVICTLTALVILIYPENIPSKDGMVLAISSFEAFYGEAAGYLLTAAIFFFAFSTVISWSYYAVESIRFITKKDICIKIYITVYCLTCILGAVMRLEAVWELSDMTVSLMTIINCSCVILLSKKHLKFK
ncbi:MAG: alanine:cation symporter family protein [Ruminococcaceae bacterium]|nr:alanine:cation symporter family protein [Oscillospiraceae bacterium]